MKRAGERILIIRLKSIGDVLFTLPAVHAVRENFPDADISYLVSKEHAPLLAGFRDVNETLTLDRRGLRTRKVFSALAGTLALLGKLRRGKYSLVIDLQGYGETAALSRWAAAPERWGIVYRAGRAWAYTRGVRRDWHVSAADWNLSMLRECGLKTGRARNEFVLPDAALEAARIFFAAHGLQTEKPTLFIQPFTSSPHKTWPLGKYLELARHWHRRGVQILFGGGPADRAALEPVRAAGLVVSAGVPLLVTGGLMKLSSLAVGADTGLLHLAVALGKRVVMLMRIRPEIQSFPFQHPDWAVSPPSETMTVPEMETQRIISASERAFQELKIRLPENGGRF